MTKMYCGDSLKLIKKALSMSKRENSKAYRKIFEDHAKRPLLVGKACQTEPEGYNGQQDQKKPFVSAVNK